MTDSPNTDWRAALEEAADQFEYYERQHRLKHTAEADAKAETNRKLAEKMRAALSIPLPEGQEGFKLVPVEPTEAMLDAGHDADAVAMEAGTGATFEKPLDARYLQRAAWTAMLAAAPLPAAPGGV
jgi:hypothetical protein